MYSFNQMNQWFKRNHKIVKGLSYHHLFYFNHSDSSQDDFYINPMLNFESGYE
jgi:hypothetical protein